MARPSSTPRLRDLDPKAIGDEVARLAVDHVISLLMQIDSGAKWSFERDPIGVLLAREASWLALYARRGLPVADWAHHGNVADALVSVCAALYSCAGRPAAVGGPDDIDADPSEPIDIVILAAQARIRIDRKQRVPVRELACLASVDPDHVRLLGRKGELEVVDGEVRAVEARRWLSARGVEGL